jgi:Xaa-Pro aminopeptidase
MNKRLEKIKQYMEENSLDSLVVTDRKNMRYLTSYTGEGYLVLSAKGNYLVTDSRYTEQAKVQTNGFEICDIASFNSADAFGGFVNTGFENESISYFLSVL